MAQVIPFPADFTQTAIVELNTSFTIPFQGLFASQAFVETGSSDPFVCASLVDANIISTVKFLMAKAQTDSSGDNGVLITLIHNSAPIFSFTYSIFLLQKGALRYQNPRLFS
jgi:hypothetical protein